MKNYTEFLKKKIAIAKEYGFEISQDEINPILKPHQKDVVQWNIKGGKRADFLSFGLGKTIIQIETCRIILKKESGKALIVCPLGIRQEFKNDAQLKGSHFEEAANKLGLDINEIRSQYGLDIVYIKNQAEAEKAPNNSILITNYERVRDGDIDPNYFTVTSLDEASILRGYGTKVYQSFLGLFKDAKYKYVCTATPSPNKYKELIHYAGYLGIMDTGQALTRFFQRDSTKANKLTLYSHKEKEFWLWLSTWGLFMTKPSDLNSDYSDEGYDLPEIKYHFHEIEVDHNSAGVEDDGQVKMYRDSAISLKDASREKRDSIITRINKMEEILKDDPESHCLLWHHLESERHEINKRLSKITKPKKDFYLKYDNEEIPTTESEIEFEKALLKYKKNCKFDVYGSQDMEVREQRIIDFSYGELKYLSTKPVIAGSGCNFQRFCHKAIFVGIDYKFNDFIQSIHRIYRFLQMFEVEIHVIYTESEREVLKTLIKKQKDHYRLVDNMVQLVKENGLSNNNTEKKLLRTMGVERIHIKTDLYQISRNDSVLEVENINDNSVGLVHTSIPFSNHYEYTPSYNDFGHTKDNEEFWEQMDFLTSHLKRILIPGRVAAIHVKDRVLFSSMTEFSFPTISPFHAECIFHFLQHDFGFLGMITIETDVVRENNQTYRLGWTEQCKDGSKMGIGSPEYLLLFRKQPTTHEDAYSDIPVIKDKSLYTRGMWQIDARAKWNSSGNRLITPEEIKGLDLQHLGKIFSHYFESNIYDYETHINSANELDKYGRLPATFEMLRLKSRSWNMWDDVNRMITLNTEQSRKKKNMHICPLQFDIVDRTINRFSNKGDYVYDPFAGLMTVPYRAVKLGRKGIGSELNADYFRDGSVYMRAIESEITMPSLFDIL